MTDVHKNFAYSTVATAPSPATSGTSLVVAAAGGALFPTVPFNAVICPVGTQPTAANAEIVRVTVVSTDTFTITRTQESTSARTVIVGDQIFAAVTKRTLDEADYVGQWSNLVAPAHPALVNSAGTSGANNTARGVRVTIPLTGTLHDLSIWVQASAANNLDIGIYDTSPTTRNRLYSSGSTAIGSSLAWQSFDPSLAVVKGDQLDFVCAVDVATATFGRLNGLASMTIMPNTSFWTSPLGGGADSTGKMSWAWTKATAFPLPSTMAESTLSTNQQPFYIIARVTPTP